MKKILNILFCLGLVVTLCSCDFIIIIGPTTEPTNEKTETNKPLEQPDYVNIEIVELKVEKLC